MRDKGRGKEGAALVIMADSRSAWRAAMAQGSSTIGRDDCPIAIMPLEGGEKGREPADGEQPPGRAQKEPTTSHAEFEGEVLRKMREAAAKKQGSNQ